MNNEYEIREEQDGHFGVYQDGDCIEKGFDSRESAQEAIEEYELEDKQAEVVSDAIDLAVDHIQDKLSGTSIEEAKKLLAEMLRG